MAASEHPLHPNPYKLLEALMSLPGLDDLMEGAGDYTTVLWKDRIVERPGAYKETPVPGTAAVIHERDEGEVFDPGTDHCTVTMGNMDINIWVNRQMIRFLWADNKELRRLIKLLFDLLSNGMVGATQFTMTFGHLNGIYIERGIWDEERKQVYA